MVSPVRPAPPPTAPAAPAAPQDLAALLAGLPGPSPLAGLRQDHGVTGRVTGAGPHGALRALIAHDGRALDGLRPRRDGDNPG